MRSSTFGIACLGFAIMTVMSVAVWISMDDRPPVECGVVVTAVCAGNFPRCRAVVIVDEVRRSIDTADLVIDGDRVCRKVQRETWDFTP